MAGITTTADHAIKQMGKSRMAVDERDVKKVYDTITNWGNPFSSCESDGIHHLASGKSATQKLEDDLIGALEKGQDAMKSFIQTRIIKSDVPFYDPIPKMKLSSFSTLSLSKVKIGGNEVIIKADRDLFARLIIIAQSRDLDLREVFSYSLGPVPWPLASGDGSLCKTVKLSLPKVLHPK